jgi:hypothetical protein
MEKRKKQAVVFAGWAAATVFFAGQWYIYDAAHRGVERFSYYLATSVYMWGVLTPIVLWLARHRPISSGTWKRAVPLHVAASLVLICVQTFVETLAGWWPHAAVWPFQAAVRHYFTQHIQIGLLTYWLILAAIHFYRMYDEARKREVHAAQLEARLAEARFQALRTQLQPHFLFNTLQAATMLIYDDPQGAEEILLSLSELLRVSLEALQEQEVSLGREMEFLKHYAAIQQRRFRDRLQFEFDVDRSLWDCAVPSLCLQPLVENAIRHGIGKHKGEDVVSIRAFRSGSELCLEVCNLTGRLDDAPERLFSRGVGLSNTLARMEQLYGARKSVQLSNLEPVGVLVTLRIPARILTLDRANVTAALGTGA